MEIITYAFFGFIVVFGTRAVDVINRLCMFGLAGSFLLLLIFVTRFFTHSIRVPCLVGFYPHTPS